LNRDKPERRLGEGMKEIRIMSRIRSRREDHSTVTAIRNGAELLIAETKSKPVIFTPGRGFSRVFR
jgi:hypothetical protein